MVIGVWLRPLVIPVFLRLILVWFMMQTGRVKRITREICKL